MIEQLVYSSSPHNIDGSSGWGVLAKTAGLQPNSNQLSNVVDCAVNPYLGNTEEDERLCRRSFFLFYSGGTWVLGCSTVTGKRWYRGDNRSGEYISHLFVLDKIEKTFQPFAYLNSPSIWRKIPDDWKKEAAEISCDRSGAPKIYPSLPELPQEPSPGQNDTFAHYLEGIDEAAVPGIGKIVEYISDLTSLYAIEHAVDDEPCIPALVFDANLSVSLNVMAIVSMLFPYHGRLGLEFCTSLNLKFADSIPRFKHLRFYGTVKEGVSGDSLTGLFDHLNPLIIDDGGYNIPYRINFVRKIDLIEFKKIVDKMDADEEVGMFYDAARRFVVRRTDLAELPTLLKKHLNDAEKLVAEIDAYFSNKQALYDVFKGVKAIPANIKNQPEWFKAISAAQTANGIDFKSGSIDTGKSAEYQEAYKILRQFDADIAEQRLNTWLMIADLLNNPSNLENVVRKVERHPDYSTVIKELILDTMQRATADLKFNAFLDFVQQRLLGCDNDIIQGVLLKGSMCRCGRLDGLQTEAENLRLKLRFAKLGLFLLLLALLGYWAGRLSAMF